MPASRAAAPHRICIFLCRHHSLASVFVALDIFRMANQLDGTRRFDILRASHDGKPVRHADGRLDVDGGLELLAQCDAVVIPSLWAQGPEAVAENPRLADALAALPRRVLVAALCSGAYLLAASGRLDGKVATTHWFVAGHFQSRFPQVALQPGENLTHDGNLVCSGGSLAGIDACLYVAQLLIGRERTRDLARMLVTDLQRGPQTLFAPAGWAQGPRGHGDREVAAVQRHIAAHLDQALRLEQLAAVVHLTGRTLQRRFLAATGMTLVQYQQAERIERAKDLLEGSADAVPEIAARVGYQDRAAFARVFKKVTGVAPVAWRQRHR